jgi:dolichol-phosphate mannosyltransferase
MNVTTELQIQGAPGAECRRPGGRPRVTLVTPAYNESESLPPYEAAVRGKLFANDAYDFQVVMVDDGSTDQTWQLICQMARSDSRFRGVRLSRNFGAHVAASAGIFEASGDAVAILPCDLQDPPEVILEFLEKWRAGAKVVWGRRRTRDDPMWRVLTSRWFSALVKRYAMPRGSQFTTGGFFLLDASVAECFRAFPEHNRITFAIVAWTGFDQAVVEYDRRRRTTGVTGYTFARMIKSMYDAFMGFSSVPGRLMTWCGIVASLLAFVLAGQLYLNWLSGHPVLGWTSVMMTLTGSFGLQFLLMGVVGEYLHRIYTEVTRRPLYFVSGRTTPAERGPGCSDDQTKSDFGLNKIGNKPGCAASGVSQGDLNE